MYEKAARRIADCNANACSRLPVLRKPVVRGIWLKSGDVM